MMSYGYLGELSILLRFRSPYNFSGVAEHIYWRYFYRSQAVQSRREQIWHFLVMITERWD